MPNKEWEGHKGAIQDPIRKSEGLGVAQHKGENTYPGSHMNIERSSFLQILIGDEDYSSTFEFQRISGNNRVVLVCVVISNTLDRSKHIF